MWIYFFVTLLLFILISHVFYWKKPKYQGRLPPGSMGLPFLGETIQFFAPTTNNDIPPFVKNKVARYGSLFRLNLLGKHMVVSTDPEISNYVFQQEGKYFQCWYPDSFNNIMGEQSLLDSQGAFHKYLKNLVLSLVGPEKLREKLLPEMEKITCFHLQSWTTHPKIDVKDRSADMVFEYIAKKLISIDDTNDLKKMMNNYTYFKDGLMSFPLNIPGTCYHASLKGRKNTIKMLKDMIEERRYPKNTSHDDFLNFLIEEMNKKETLLNEVIVINLVFILLFATYETTSTAITATIKFLVDHPSVLEELKKEHEEVLKMRGNEQSGITWKEYKSMSFTHMFINEMLRIANIAPWIFRKVINDVELKGYTIPRGWMMMVSTTSLHLNPEKYENPLTFNPWRWEGKELHSGSKSFMAFGGGVRLCVGAEFTKLQMAIFLHHLLTKYRWDIVEGGNILRRPSLIFPDGLHIKVSEK